MSDIHKASDVKEYQRVAQDKKASFKIIAKIQNKDAVDNFSEIAKAADGIMLSRSYLAVHMPPEKVSNVELAIFLIFLFIFFFIVVFLHAETVDFNL